MSNIVFEQAKEDFNLACIEAQTLQTINNFTAAFTAGNVVNLLRQSMTDDIMKQVFMPIMNTKVGFLTDRTGKPDSRGNLKNPYSIEIVRDAIIDAVSIGLLPTGNQMNIIAERMYPTKEGYTSLLKRLGAKYFIEVYNDKSQINGFAEIPCKISYEFNKDKNSFTITAIVKKTEHTSPDLLRGKAERRAKKALYEYLTGCDFGEADATEFTEAKDVTAEEKLKHDVQSTPKQTINIDDAQGVDMNANVDASQNAAPAPEAPIDNSEQSTDKNPETPNCFL